MFTGNTSDASFSLFVYRHGDTTLVGESEISPLCVGSLSRTGVTESGIYYVQGSNDDFYLKIFFQANKREGWVGWEAIVEQEAPAHAYYQNAFPVEWKTVTEFTGQGKAMWYEGQEYYVSDETTETFKVNISADFPNYWRILWSRTWRMGGPSPAFPLFGFSVYSEGGTVISRVGPLCFDSPGPDVEYVYVCNGLGGSKNFYLEITTANLKNWTFTIEETKIPTTISCNVTEPAWSLPEVAIGDSVTVKGSVTLDYLGKIIYPYSAGLSDFYPYSTVSGKTVTLTYKKPDNSTFYRIVTTDSNGSYEDTYTPSDFGNWSVIDSWLGDSTYLGAISLNIEHGIGPSNFTVTKIPTSISCYVSSSNLTIGASVTVSGSISRRYLGTSVMVSGKNVTLAYKKPDGTTVTRIVTTSDGNYSDSYMPDVVGSWNVSASWDGDSLHSGAVSIPMPFLVKKSGCLIATATFGSELSQEVQFLRDFRDKTVLNTFAGSNFMTAFNSFYYSFSPSVASTISENEALRSVMKVVLFPLIGVLHISSVAFSIFSFSSELAIVVTGLIASSLIALVYFTPWFLLVNLFKNFRPSIKIIRFFSLFWVSSIVAIVLAETTMSPPLMMASSGALVLTTMTLITLASTRTITKFIIPH